MLRRLVTRTPRRIAAALVAAVAVLVSLEACAARPRPVPSARAPEAPPGRALFSTIPCAETSLGREWSGLRGEAEARFPGLNLTRVEDLHGAPEAWQASVVAAKDTLNRLGLKRPESYDAAFRPHVTLASARRSPPDSADSSALEALRTWLARQVAADERRFTVTVGPDTPVRLWLAGTARPPGAPIYIDLAEFLARP